MELITHKLYRLDDVLESWDLWLLQPVKITWADYLCGKTLVIPYIDGELNVFIEPFKITSPYCVKTKGLCGLGNLYFIIEIEPPSSVNKSKWDKLDHKFKNCFLRELYDLYTV